MTRSFVFILPIVLFSFFTPSAFAGNQGTTISVENDASSTQTQTDTYSWSIQKTLKPNQVPYIIRQGSTLNVEYLLTATRSGPSTTYANTATSGSICVHNTGSQPTVGLWVTVSLQQSLDNGTTWTNFAGPQVLTVPEVVAGDTQCFPYTFTETLLPPPAIYRNYDTVSLDNYVGNEGTSHSINAIGAVVVTPSLVEIDKTATISDVFTCPAGFSCSPLNSTIPLTGSYLPTPYPVSLTNNSAACGQTLPALNTATLTPSTNPALPPVSATATIYTGTCH